MKMDFNYLKYIKNVNGDIGWAYHTYPKGAYFQLNFKEGEGVESHALRLTKKSLIILSQKPPNADERHLTHVVELVNEGSEDKSQWQPGTWGIFRWVKVSWVVADFDNPSLIPLDKEVMRAEWGWYDTKAKSLDSRSLRSTWGNMNKLKEHLKPVFC
jgi:hypothetical protein